MTETTQQHIVRRDQLRVSEARGGPTGGVPDHIRAMMLLLFAGLDDKEQPNVVPSCGNDYDVKNISHVLSGKSPPATRATPWPLIRPSGPAR